MDFDVSETVTILLTAIYGNPVLQVKVYQIFAFLPYQFRKKSFYLSGWQVLPAIGMFERTSKKKWKVVEREIMIGCVKQ